MVRDRSNSAGQLGYPLWSPDGASIAYARQSRPAYESLWRYDARDGTSEELYNYLPPDGQIVPAAWSPDGSQVYFWRSPIYSASIMADGLPLWVVQSNGGEASNLGVTTLLYSDYVTVAAGGRLIVADGGGRVSLGNKRLALVDPGSAAQVLTAVEAASVAPAWSPDARQVAFVAAPDRYDIAAGLIAPMADRRIWLMDADGANQRRLLPDQELAEEGPQWSRDGASILFVRPSFLIARDHSRLEATLWLANLKDASTILVVEGLRLDMGTY